MLQAAIPPPDGRDCLGFSNDLYCQSSATEDSSHGVLENSNLASQLHLAGDVVRGTHHGLEHPAGSLY